MSTEQDTAPAPTAAVNAATPAELDKPVPELLEELAAAIRAHNISAAVRRPNVVIAQQVLQGTMPMPGGLTQHVVLAEPPEAPGKVAWCWWFRGDRIAGGSEIVFLAHPSDIATAASRVAHVLRMDGSDV